MFIQIVLITTIQTLSAGLTQEVADKCPIPKCNFYENYNKIFYKCSLFKGIITIGPRVFDGDTIIKCEGEFKCCELKQIDRDVLNLQIYDKRHVQIFDCALPSKLMFCMVEHFGIQDLSSLVMSNVTGGNSTASNTSRLYKALPNKVFQGLVELTSLVVSRSEMTNITSTLFSNLRQLQYLYVDDSHLKFIDNDSFTPLMQLRSLTLIGNEIQKLPAGLFKRLDKLVDIQLSYNSLPLHFEPKLLADLPELREVNIQYCGLTTLPDNLLQRSYSIEKLTLAHNKLTAIPNRLLEDQEDLQFMDLRDNNIKFITSDMFSSLSSLSELQLDENCIEELPNLVFSNLFNLRTVSVTNNHLRHIGAKAFTIKVDANKLQGIYLSGNQLTMTSDVDGSDSYLHFGWYTPFLGLTELQCLDLSYNLIEDKAMIGNAWRFSVNLQRIDLSSNHISRLNIIEDDTWNKDIVIDCRRNNITHVTSPNKSRSSDFSPRILLKNNPLHCDCHLLGLILRYHMENSSSIDNIRKPYSIARCATPEKFKDLFVADLTQRDFTCHSGEQFCPNECNCTLRPYLNIKLELNCKSLPLSNNLDVFLGLNWKSSVLSLQVAPESLVALPEQVRELHLRGLQLRHAPRAPSPYSLDLLDLFNNSLTTAPTELLNSSDTLSLRLERNPIACDCLHVESLTILKSNRHRIIDYTNVTCDTGLALMHIDIEQLCSPKTVVVISNALTGFCVVIMLVVVLFSIFKNEIKVYLYARGLCRWWVHEEDLDRDKIYDAFVTFSHRDASFVIDELVPVLEHEPNSYKLCLHYRDWVVGEWIPTQIMESVNQSRRTIVVLSKNFLSSEWTRHEFRAAHASALREGRAHIIVILLDELTDDDRHGSELRAYLSTNTYIRSDDPWFWKRLRYALPHRHRNC